MSNGSGRQRQCSRAQPHPATPAARPGPACYTAHLHPERRHGDLGSLEDAVLLHDVLGPAWLARARASIHAHAGVHLQACAARARVSSLIATLRYTASCIARQQWRQQAGGPPVMEMMAPFLVQDGRGRMRPQCRVYSTIWDSIVASCSRKPATACNREQVPFLHCSAPTARFSYKKTAIERCSSSA